MNRRLPPLNALRVFEAAARHESFSLAAEELRVTHSAISHQVKTLESWLGTPLFRRVTRAVRLTDAGRSYQPVVAGAFNQIQAGTAALTATLLDAPLHVTTTQAFAVRWLAPRLRRLWDTHPDLDLRLHEHSWLEGVDFSKEEVDVAVRIGAERGPGVEAVPLLAGTVTPMCSPGLVNNGPSVERPEDLCRYKLLHAFGHRPWIEWFQQAGVTGADAALGPVFDDTNLVYAAALSGQGVGLMHTALVREELEAKQLTELFPTEAREDMGYYVHFRKVEADEPRIARFRDWLLAVADAPGR